MFESTTPFTHPSAPYKAYSQHSYRQIPQVSHLSQEDLDAIDIVSTVLPFKVNSYVVNELIDWSNIPDDPIYTLTFPRREMLEPEHYARMERLVRGGASAAEIKAAAMEIRQDLNPHPAGQRLNIPEHDGTPLPGIQHKYRETVLFFPTQGQTCHAYCTFCFRWPQFVGMNDVKFAMKETDLLVGYLRDNRHVTDVLFTGGDPMIMKTSILASYIDPLLSDDLSNVQTIRIGTKALGYWPYRFTTDRDAPELLELFRRVVASGRNLSIMAHFNHPVELQTPAVREAVRALRSVGVQIRTQSPLLKNINNHPEIWAEMWRQQVNMNMIPYYMFVERDTGSKSFFEVPLVEAWNIFRDAYQHVSGVCRTVRGPSMSATPGKVQILGVSEIAGEKVFTLRFIQGRNPDWVARPFFAKFDPKAMWLDQLQPAFGETEFFFEPELADILQQSTDPQP